MRDQARIEAREVDSRRRRWYDHGQCFVASLKLLAETCVFGIGTEELLSEMCDFRSKGEGLRFVACALPADPGGGLAPLTALIVGHWTRCAETVPPLQARVRGPVSFVDGLSSNRVSLT